MKILLLADLHSERPWYRWILSELAHYDIVRIAGDLIDTLKRIEEQIEFLREQWLPPFLKTGTPLAVCSGNHDFSIAPWFSAMPYLGVIANGQTEIVEKLNGERLVVTTCPYVYSFHESGFSSYLNKRRTLWAAKPATAPVAMTGAAPTETAVPITTSPILPTTAVVAAPAAASVAAWPIA